MIQQIDLALWSEFQSEIKKVNTFDIQSLELTPQHNEALDKFFKKFLDPSEEFPSGKRHDVIEKNFAIWILQHNISVEKIKEAYKSKKFNFNSLLTQIKGVKEKTYKGNVSVGELVNWCKEFRPDLVPLFQTIPTNHLDLQEKFQFLSLNELKNYQEIHQDYIVDRLIPSRAVGILGGKRSAFKSWVALGLGLSVSAGLEFLGFKTNEVPVLYLDRENSYSELKKRSKMIENGLIKQCDNAPIHFYDGYFKMDNLSDLEQIEKYVKEKGIKLILIDVYRRAVSFDENDANKVSQFFVDIIKPFSNRTGATVLFLAHEKKGESPDEMDNLRGSSDVVNYADFVLTLTRKGNNLVLKQLKSRRSKEIEPLSIQVETDEESFMKFKCLGVAESQTEADRCAKNMIVFLAESNIKEIKFSDFVNKGQSLKYSLDASKGALNELSSRGILVKGITKKSPYKVDLTGVKLEDYL